MKPVRTAGIALLSVGASVLLFVFYELVGTAMVTKGHQSVLRTQFMREIAEPRSPPPAPSPAPPPRTKAKPKAVLGAVARLTIPRIRVDVMVVEGVTLRDLAWGPGVYPEGADVGAPGSTAIAGHRTGWSAPFFHMEKLRRGDPITLQTRAATYSYRVTRSVIVGPDEGWVLAGDPDSSAKVKLTLTTCTPRFTARDRLIVWADLVGTRSRQAVSAAA